MAELQWRKPQGQLGLRAFHKVSPCPSGAAAKTTTMKFSEWQRPWQPNGFGYFGRRRNRARQAVFLQNEAIRASGRRPEPGHHCLARPRLLLHSVPYTGGQDSALFPLLGSQGSSVWPFDPQLCPSSPLFTALQFPQRGTTVYGMTIRPTARPSVHSGK